MSQNDTSPLAPGYRLDRYELLGPLAEGGMASVWIARQRGKHGFEKLVAIKTILPQYASDDRFRQMFLDEARIASRIEHFNVARIIDLGEEHEVLYLVMEYVDGDSLSKLRRACTKAGVHIPPGVLLRILADACSGLHEAHELKDENGQLLDIVHRDISPHNILISTKGVAKVIDFGIAKARDRMAGETNAGVLKGKIQYMAPEQALGRKVDRRADLWAVGATLYHLLTGKPPFDADNTLGTLHLLTSGRPPLPLPPNVPPAVAAIVRKALTSAVDARFHSAAQMRDAMEAAMIDAKIATSGTDVAAFLNAQLSERTVKRRQVVDIALAAAAERERIVEVLKPAIERTGSGLTSAPPPANERTIAEAPAALRSSAGADVTSSSFRNPSHPCRDRRVRGGRAPAPVAHRTRRGARGSRGRGGRGRRVRHAAPARRCSCERAFAHDVEPGSDPRRGSSRSSRPRRRRLPRPLRRRAFRRSRSATCPKQRRPPRLRPLSGPGSLPGPAARRRPRIRRRRRSTTGSRRCARCLFHFESAEAPAPRPTGPRRQRPRARRRSRMASRPRSLFPRHGRPRAPPRWPARRRRR